jgi:hypothetical protein
MILHTIEQGLEPVLGTDSGILKNPNFVRFQKTILEGTLNLKKKKKSSRTGSWESEILKRVPEPVLWNSKFVKRVAEPVPWNPKF